MAFNVADDVRVKHTGTEAQLGIAARFRAGIHDPAIRDLGWPIML
jgi:hypothetical protein